MATINLEKLATALINVDGEKAAVKKILKSKGEVILDNGTRIPLEGVYAKGRGFFYDSPKKTTGRTKPAATPAASPKPAAPAANAVTFEELEGKYVAVNGERLAVEGFLRSKHLVKLEGGERVEISRIVRKGRGYVVAEEQAAAPVRKPRESAPAANNSEVIVPKDLRGVTVKVDGVAETVEKIFTSKNQVKTAEGTLIDVARLERKGSRFIYTTTGSKKPEAKPAKKEEAAPRSGGIRRRDEVVNTSAPIKKEGRKEKPTSKTKTAVEAFTADIAEELKVLVEDVAKAAVLDTTDLQFITSASVFNDNVVTLEVTFAVGSLSPKKVAKLLEELNAEEEEEDEGDELESGEEEGEDEGEEEGEDFGDDELEEDEDENEEDEDENEEEEDEDENEEEDEGEEEDEYEDEEDEEEEDELEAKIDASVAALEKLFGKHSSYKELVENYYLSDKVEEAFGDDMEPGVTKLQAANGNVYVLLGLDASNDTIMLLNKKTAKVKRSEIAEVARMEEV